jgi:hypothetical protein
MKHHAPVPGSLYRVMEGVRRAKAAQMLGHTQIRVEVIEPMIMQEQHPQALRALQRLIVHAKAQAYEAGQAKLAELLNDIELLPEFLADEADRTGEFIEMLQGIARLHPTCRCAVEEALRLPTTSA